jgi:hypothetical protein
MRRSIVLVVFSFIFFVSAAFAQSSQAPLVRTEPWDQKVKIGSSMRLVSRIFGTQPITVQWQRSIAGGAFTNIPGATGAVYLYKVSQEDNGALFRFVATNVAGTVTSRSAKLTTYAGSGSGQATIPRFVEQPRDTSIRAPFRVSFFARALGGNVTYSWERQQSDGSYTRVSQPSRYRNYSFKSVEADDKARFRVVATNSLGSVTSQAALLTVLPARVVAGQGPAKIIRQPLNDNTVSGGYAYFRVTAGGLDPLTRQWQQSINGGPFQDIPGQTGRVCKFVATDQMIGTSRVRVVVSNSLGTVTSEPATLTVVGRSKPR